MSEAEQNKQNSGSTDQTPAQTPALSSSPSPAVRWFHPLRQMEREFERFFNRPLSLSLRDWPRWDEWIKQSELALPALPAIDVIDRDAEVVVRAQVPGLTAEDLEVTVSEQNLTLRGHKQTESEETGEFYHREISSQEFVRTISLPAAVDVDKATANCKDGVLEITLPKREVVRKQKLTIQSA
jgi:HSP20 family protein